MSANMEEAFNFLRKESGDLFISDSVQEVHSLLDALPFYRDYVSKNLPVLMKGCVRNWPAVSKWTNSYLVEKLPPKHAVTVAVTPNGYADAVVKDQFVMADDEIMPFTEFINILEAPENNNGIYYIQKQNSNLNGEFSNLKSDVGNGLVEWANNAFGKEADAANFWMGDERAVSSLHKDPYENIYCVVRGTKIFTLIPPIDLPFVPYQRYPQARYKRNSKTNRFDIINIDGADEIPWIPVDPVYPDYENHPDFCNARIITVNVEAGDVLYLPSFWFHHVRQSHGCIAVNYWYDMEYDVKYVYYKFLEKLSKKDI